MADLRAVTRRQLTRMVDEWWETNYADEWDAQMWTWGYCDLTEDRSPGADAVRRVSLVAEMRWHPKHDNSPSRLWDGCHHARGHPCNVKARAQVRASMPHMLGLWRRRKGSRNG